VIQALGCAKPCYLFVPPGHLEQAANFRYYMEHFVGVASPDSETIQGWADRALRPADTKPMLEQAHRVRDWLNEFDSAAERTLVRSIRRAAEAMVQPAAVQTAEERRRRVLARVAGVRLSEADVDTAV
jgi:hypothetical protein